MLKQTETKIIKETSYCKIYNKVILVVYTTVKKLVAFHIALGATIF